MTYQPDVVVVRGGASAIRSASADGLVWKIDPRAPGASDLAVGKVMLLTSDAAGRVAAISDEGDSRVVTLAPVDLSSIVRDADIKIDRDIDPSTMVYQVIPNQPGVQSDPSAGGEDSGAKAAQRDGDAQAVLLSAPYIPLPTPPVPTPPTIPIGAWTVKPTADATKLGLGISYKANAGLKLGVDLALLLDHFHVTSEEAIKDGTATRTGTLLHGITGLQVSLSAGAANASADNAKVRFEVPVEMSFPIPPGPETGGLPLQVTVTYTFSVETAITGNNSTLVGTGKYRLDGPIGVQDLKPVGPTLSVQQSLTDSLQGITIGPTGIVVAMKTKVRLGLGVPGFKAGPYGAVTIAIGVTKGSSLGSPLATCEGVTLDIRVAGGVSLSLSPVTRAALNAVLPATAKADENGIEVSTSVFHKSTVTPDVPLCHAGT